MKRKAAVLLVAAAGLGIYYAVSLVPGPPAPSMGGRSLAIGSQPTLRGTYRDADDDVVHSECTLDAMCDLPVAGGWIDGTVGGGSPR